MSWKGKFKLAHANLKKDRNNTRIAESALDKLIGKNKDKSKEGEDSKDTIANSSAEGSKVKTDYDCDSITLDKEKMPDDSNRNRDNNTPETDNTTTPKETKVTNKTELKGGGRDNTDSVLENQLEKGRGKICTQSNS